MLEVPYDYTVLKAPWNSSLFVYTYEKTKTMVEAEANRWTRYFPAEYGQSILTNAWCHVQPVKVSLMDKSIMFDQS